VFLLGLWELLEAVQVISLNLGILREIESRVVVEPFALRAILHAISGCAGNFRQIREKRSPK